MRDRPRSTRSEICSVPNRSKSPSLAPRRIGTRRSGLNSRRPFGRPSAVLKIWGSAQTRCAQTSALPNPNFSALRGCVKCAPSALCRCGAGNGLATILVAYYVDSTVASGIFGTENSTLNQGCCICRNFSPFANTRVHSQCLKQSRGLKQQSWTRLDGKRLFIRDRKSVV